MIGQTISHYKILEKLGEGGMGVVYKAQDLKLDRLVALKFLPQQITISAEDEARFLQEAKAISALNHPHIATIFDTDEIEGQKFLVLEYIPGGTLKCKLKHLQSEDKEFSPAEVLDYGIQAAEALAHAHRHQIIHRDVKTDNLMLTEEGKVKLTDFGLAKLRGRAQVTKKGTTVGTAAYMSPEQIRGEEVDQRSDIFSLGVVLYELLTSRLPFRGEFETALNYSILNEEPPSVMSLRKEAPPALEKIIHRCLTKEKAKRYQSAEEVADALTEIRQEISPATKARRTGMKIPLLIGCALFVVAAIVVAYLFWLAKPITAIEKSVAVLPFDDMSPQKDQEYFCNGMTEELINSLSKIKELRVPARTSVFMFKGKLDIWEIGEKLKVQTVLEGSVRKDSSRLRVTAQLINVADGYHIWSNTYDRELRDIFTIQDEIALAIAGELRLTLLGEEKGRLLKHHTADPAAYDLFLRGRFFLYKYTEADLRRSLEFFDRAINVDSNFASAYYGIAMAWSMLADEWLAPHNAYGKALVAARQAIAIDSSDADGHAALSAPLLWYQWDANSAKHEAQKAVLLGPNSPEAHWALGWVYGFGYYEWQNALDEFRLGLRIDPLSSFYRACEVQALTYLGRYTEAHLAAGRALEFDSTYAFAWWKIGDLYMDAHQYSEAVRAYGRAKEASSSVPLLLAEAYARSGDPRKAREIVYKMEQKREHDYIRAETFARAYLSLDDKANAIRWLERAVDDRSGGCLVLAHEKVWDPLRGDPRFDDLARRATPKR
jgi:eukaryotic-like serine/threonine-protein kinase